MEFVQDIAGALNLRAAQVEAVLSLFEDGATIPFIARYRKDKTGALDEVVIAKIQEEAKTRKEFAERKAAIEKSITEQGKMTEELQAKINKAKTLSELEDIYLPYKPKRKTKASVAREHGLEPLADLLMAQDASADPETAAAAFLTENVKTVDEALQGARDIIAENVNENAELRNAMRKLFEDQARMESKLVPGKEADAQKYKDYFEFSETIKTIPSHRVLAILRGFLEGVLRLSITPLEDDAIERMERMFVKGSNACTPHVKKALRDSWKRLLQPSLETEFRTALKQKADEDAIQVFAENLRQLLLSSPLGSKKILAIDPGYRTGCKVVCLDEKGDLKETAVIYIHEPGRLMQSEYLIRDLVKKYGTEAFAIGDGTAGRETEQFIKKMNLGIPVFLVNEDGASVYSASETARLEFPDHDVTVRGSVSIGRRLMDPLAELVKIDPKSIGVGQYQHDVNQFRLKEKLDQTVVSCVNMVGVNLNTASKHLLAYVSGINSSIAENIISYRNTNGKFNSRKELLKVARLGDKAFEQSAGFLRIKEAEHPLDATGVHPESYHIVERMAADLKVELKELIGNASVVNGIDIRKYITPETGEHTLKDILNELKKPGLDPRSEAQQFEFAQIFSIEDVKTGEVIPGVVTNLTRFGAFVDIGVKQDGLVHISEISHDYITDPSEKLKLNQKLMVKVLEVDISRKRISLSIKQAEEGGNPRTKREGGSRPVQKEPDLSALNMNDALSALKKKFGK
ncbi:MAG TPA: Tex family protein [Chitinophagaceae bacterium]|nr:Tex family protein [Chitinophagaceae bacterium]